MPFGTANASSTVYSQLSNNAAKWWWQDAGMRKLANPDFVSSIGNPDDNKLGAHAMHLGPIKLTCAGLISAAYPLGGLIGIFPAPWVADRFGRRYAIACGAALIIAGGVIQTATSGGWEMFGGRMVVGVGSSFQVWVLCRVSSCYIKLTYRESGADLLLPRSLILGTGRNAPP